MINNISIRYFIASYITVDEILYYEFHMMVFISVHERFSRVLINLPTCVTKTDVSYLY